MVLFFVRSPLVCHSRATPPKSSFRSLRGTPRAPAAQKRCYITTKRATTGRPYKDVSKHLVGASIARPQNNDVTSFLHPLRHFVPPLPKGEARNAPMLRHVVCRDRRPRLSAKKRCYFAFGTRLLRNLHLIRLTLLDTFP